MSKSKNVRSAFNHIINEVYYGSGRYGGRSYNYDRGEARDDRRAAARDRNREQAQRDNYKSNYHHLNPHVTLHPSTEGEFAGQTELRPHYAKMRDMEREKLNAAHERAMQDSNTNQGNFHQSFDYWDKLLNSRNNLSSGGRIHQLAHRMSVHGMIDPRKIPQEHIDKLRNDLPHRAFHAFDMKALEDEKAALTHADTTAASYAQKNPEASDVSHVRWAAYKQHFHERDKSEPYRGLPEHSFVKPDLASKAAKEAGGPKPPNQTMESNNLYRKGIKALFESVLDQLNEKDDKAVEGPVGTVQGQQVRATQLSPKYLAARRARLDAKRAAQGKPVKRHVYAEPENSSKQINYRNGIKALFEAILEEEGNILQGPLPKRLKSEEPSKPTTPATISWKTAVARGQADKAAREAKKGTVVGSAEKIVGAASQKPSTEDEKLQAAWQDTAKQKFEPREDSSKQINYRNGIKALFETVVDELLEGGSKRVAMDAKERAEIAKKRKPKGPPRKMTSDDLAAEGNPHLDPDEENLEEMNGDTRFHRQADLLMSVAGAAMGDKEHIEALNNHAHGAPLLNHYKDVYNRLHKQLKSKGVYHPDANGIAHRHAYESTRKLINYHDLHDESNPFPE